MCIPNFNSWLHLFYVYTVTVNRLLIQMYFYCSNFHFEFEKSETISVAQKQINT